MPDPLRLGAPETSPSQEPALRAREVVALVARLGLLLSLVVFVALAVVAEEAPLVAGQPAPAAHLVSYDGREWDLDRFAGRPVLVTFWATWCGPCIAEMPSLVAAADRHREDVVFVGAVVDSPPAEVFSVIRRFDVRFPIAAAEPATIRAWQATAVPSTYLLDAGHRVVWSARGAVDGDTLDRAIAGLVAPP